MSYSIVIISCRLDNNFPDAAFGYAKYREIRSNFSQALEYVNRVLAIKSDYLPAILENMKLQLCMQDWEQCEDVAQRFFFCFIKNSIF